MVRNGLKGRSADGGSVRNVMELDQIDVPAAAVPGDLEQIDHAFEARAAREIAGDVGEGNGLDPVDHDVAAFHRIEAADLDVRPLPDPHAAGDPALADPFAEALGEHHCVRAGRNGWIPSLARATLIFCIAMRD